MPESPGLARRTQVLTDDATAGFVGRAYVFHRIESFLAENRSGYFRLIADPGDGKTAIMAEYVRRMGSHPEGESRKAAVGPSEKLLGSRMGSRNYNRKILLTSRDGGI